MTAEHHRHGQYFQHFVHAVSIFGQDFQGEAQPHRDRLRRCVEGSPAETAHRMLRNLKAIVKKRFFVQILQGAAYQMPSCRPAARKSFNAPLLTNDDNTTVTLRTCT
jgi:hypothetical protein